MKLFGRKKKKTLFIKRADDKSKTIGSIFFLKDNIVYTSIKATVNEIK